MGGRGARSGSYALYGKNLTYGDEYATVSRFSTFAGEVKVVVRRDDKAPSVPRETMTGGRIYALLAYDKRDGEPYIKSIATYDYQGKKNMQIDLDHNHKSKVNTIKGAHVHFGYDHGFNQKRKDGHFKLDDVSFAKRLAEEVIRKSNTSRFIIK